MGRLADAVRAAATIEAQGPSGLWYRVQPVTTLDTLIGRAPMLLASVSPRPVDNRGKVLPKPGASAGADDEAAKAALGVVYTLACAGCVAWRSGEDDWEPVRLVEGDTAGPGEERVALIPWGDLSVIAAAASQASGLTASRGALQPFGAGHA